MSETYTPEQASHSTSPGAVLARARTARQLSIEQAARELKLPRTTLQYIESDCFEQIAPIYRRGYISNYARLVGIDPEPLLASLGPANPEPLKAVLPVSGKMQRFDRFLKFATYALVTTMIVPPLVYFFVLGGARLFESDMAARGESDDGALTSQVQKPGYRERFADALAVQPLDSTPQPGTHLSASALPMTPIRSLSREDTTSAASDAETAGPPEVQQDALSDLELVLSDDSWVEIESADGERLEFDLLREGQSRNYSGLAPFRLLLGRGSAVELSLDGETVAFTGQESAGVTELVVGEAGVSRNDGADVGGKPAD